MTALARQRGFSLVELMVALVLGLVLITGVIQIYLSTKAGYNLQTGMARAQENGRYAVDFLTRDLRMTGDPGGCGGNLSAGFTVNVLADDNPNDGAADFVIDANTVLRGHEEGAGFTPPAGVPFWTDPSDPTDPPEDAVTIIRADASSQQPLDSDMGRVNFPILVPGGNFATGDVALIADCEQADVFVVTNTSGTAPLQLSHAATGNTSANLSRAYRESDGATVSRAIERIYYIGQNPDGGPSLYRTGSEGTFELVPGVERLQLQWGQDTNNDDNVDLFLDANAVTNWSQIMAAQVDVLTRTPEGVSPTAADYAFREDGNVTTTTPPTGDSRLRRWYAGTVALRNLTP